MRKKNNNNQNIYSNNKKKHRGNKCSIAETFWTISETGWRYCSAPAKQLTATTLGNRVVKIITRKVIKKRKVLCDGTAVWTVPTVTYFIHAHLYIHVYARPCAFVRICDLCGGMLLIIMQILQAANKKRLKTILVNICLCTYMYVHKPMYIVYTSVRFYKSLYAALFHFFFFW